MILFSHLLWHVKPPLESTKVAGFFSLPRFRCPAVFAVLSSSFSKNLADSCGEQVIHVNLSSYFQKFCVRNLLWPENGMMFQRYVVWKVENYLSSASVKRQHSETYCRVDEL